MAVGSPNRSRKFAIDCDGVLFDFNTRYAELIEQQTGIKVPPVTKDWPNEWNWESTVGVNKSQQKELWNEICGELSYKFWRYLPAYEWSRDFLAQCASHGEMVFITARCGKHCQKATREALEILGVHNPNVIIAYKKTPVLIAEQVTDFLDDRPENMLESSVDDGAKDIRLWLLDQPWNRRFNPPYITRIDDPRRMLDVR